ncbi:zinc finger protein 521-like [Wyeomyia smithii]|uniref:zinc finger protein 521-like n=1 Tax=Wyeomyia smithii TaxID=174621 RepID=UPI00246821D1|nr:zinc finger protein 521-like [Wyeomyia smithii]
MDKTTFTLWDPSQPNAKMRIINIPGQGHTQYLESVSEISKIARQPATNEQIILQTHDGQEFLVDENEIDRIDQIPPENLIYMSADDGSFIQGEVVHVQADGQQIHEELAVQQNQQQYMECEVTEEVITDDWVQTDGQDCVQVTVDQLGATTVIGSAEDEETVPLPTDQDEYTTSRPYPCDFCSRRFRKKANLMNHMIAHSNDRPHVCNLCGARYMRRCDLLNHLKLHAYSTDDHEEPIRSDPEDDYDYELSNSPPTSPDQHSPTLEDDDDDLLVPAPSQYRTPKPKQIRKPRAKNSASAAKLSKKPSTSSSNNRPRQMQQKFDNSFNSSIEPFVNLPPRFPVTDERKPFVCQHCGISFAREKALASHARVHGGDCQFECESCGDRFWDKTMLQDHIRQRHAANLVVTGPKATKSSYTLLQPEIENHTLETENAKQNFYCDSCGAIFPKPDQLKRHIKQTHSSKEQMLEPISQIVRQRQQHSQQIINFDGEEDEDQAQYDEVESQTPLSCNVCGERFAEALDLLAHAEVHTRFEPHRCQLCRETFIDEKTIKEHVQHIHKADLTDTSCVVCGKSCRTHAALLKHAWEHSRERLNYGTHCCSKCGKTFYNKARLKRHMVSHRNKSVKCEVCLEEFPDGRSLMNHRHSHTKSRQFPCNVCGKTFGSRSSQQIHLRIHSGERPYGCRFCWKAFADGGTLRKHERVHTGEKPYGCSVCPRAFNQRVVLREHIRSHHSAPDSKQGTATQPYFCSVCTQLFESSAELIQHLIQHSDLNTAMKRQPPTFPRKYKRRKKLKSSDGEKQTPPKWKKKSNMSRIEEAVSDGVTEDEDPLKNPAEILLEYGTGNCSKKLIASPKYINSYELLASTSGITHAKPGNLDDSGINLLSDVVLINSPSTTVDTKFRPDVSESPKRRGGKQPSTIANFHTILGQPSTSASNSRPRMIHTQKTRVSATDGKRNTKTIITKDIKCSPESKQYSTLEFKRAKSRSVATYQEIPSDKISSESFPLLDDGCEDDCDGDEEPQDDALSPSITEIDRKQDVPAYEDLLNQNLLMEISRKDKYIDKYNSDIVNDLEEILRSPIKNATNNVPPTVIMATPKTSHSQQYDPVAEKQEEKKPTKLMKYSKSNDHHSLTSILRSQRLTRRQLEREVNFLREAYGTDSITIKQEKDSPDKLSTMLLNDVQPTSSTLVNPKQEPLQNLPISEALLEAPEPERFECEMCFATFEDRSQLLLHVPVHI